MVGRDLRDWFVHFEALEDPRVERGKRHELNDIITIAVLAVISAGDGFTDMHTFAEAKLAWLKTFLKLPNGVPSHDTFGRVLAALDPDAFEQCLLQWTEALAAESGGPLVAIDGKTIRASVDKAAKKSAIHMVNAWCNINHLVLGQVATDSKSNEITAIPRLLKLLDLQGAMVTIDATSGGGLSNENCTTDRGPRRRLRVGGQGQSGLAVRRREAVVRRSDRSTTRRHGSAIL